MQMVPVWPGSYSCRGLPGAGKSTWAAAWRDVDPEHRVIVSRDQIRFELYGQYNALTQAQENHVTYVQTDVIEQTLRQGKSVIVDDTNLEREHLDQWTHLAESRGVVCEVIVINTPLTECLRRNRNRAAAGGRFVSEQVIRDMDRLAEWAS